MWNRALPQRPLVGKLSIIQLSLYTSANGYFNIQNEMSAGNVFWKIQLRVPTILSRPMNHIIAMGSSWINLGGHVSIVDLVLPLGLLHMIVPDNVLFFCMREFNLLYILPLCFFQLTSQGEYFVNINIYLNIKYKIKVNIRANLKCDISRNLYKLHK